MKHYLKLLLILALALPLTLNAQPKPKFSIYAGATFFSSLAEYNYNWSDEYTGEQVSTAADLIKGSLFGGDATLGVMIGESLEIYAGYSLLSHDLDGHVDFQIPGIFLYNDEATSTLATKFSLKQNVINIGAAYHVNLNSPIEPYIGAGISIINAKLETPEDIAFTDSYEGTWYYWWWYTWFDEDSHAVSIDNVTVTEQSLSKTAFHLRFGLLAQIAKNIAVYTEARYILNAEAPATVQLSAASSGEAEIGGVIFTDTRSFEADPQTVNVNLGGLWAAVGLRLEF